MICTIGHCRNKYYARKLCKKHYKKWFHYGNPWHSYNRKCSVKDCEKEIHGHSLCQTHYRRLQRNGIPGEAKLRKRPFGSGGFDRGYMKKVTNGKAKLEHRKVWEQFFGPIPKGYVIHHKDKNRANNHISNLELMSRADHSRHHRLETLQ